MKFLVTADWHFTNANPKFKLDNRGVSDLLTRQTQFGHWLADLLQDPVNEYDGLLFLGDITDKETLDPITLSHLNSAVGRLTDAPQFKIWLEGNHCIEDTKSQYTVLAAMREIAGSNTNHFVTQPRSISYQDKIVFHCVPYLGDYQAIESHIAELNTSLDTSKVNILLFHFPTVNALLDNGLPSKAGVNLSKEITSNFAVCLGGDFHTPQQLINSNNAFYVGAPFSLKFGEEGAHRGIVELTIDDDGAWEMRRLDNPFASPMVTLTPAQALKLSKSERAKSIVRLTEAPTQEDRIAIEELRGEFYRLEIPGVRHAAMKVAPTDAQALLAEISRGDDAALIRNFMEKNNYEAAMVDAAITMFTAVCTRE